MNLKYKRSGHFFFKGSDNLNIVCNAPNDCSGLYLIYALERQKVKLIYIGISGRQGVDGNIIHRQDGLRGRFLTGKQLEPIGVERRDKCGGYTDNMN